MEQSAAQNRDLLHVLVERRRAAAVEYLKLDRLLTDLLANPDTAAALLNGRPRPRQPANIYEGVNVPARPDQPPALTDRQRLAVEAALPSARRLRLNLAPDQPAAADRPARSEPRVALEVALPPADRQPRRPWSAAARKRHAAAMRKYWTAARRKQKAGRT